MGRYVVHMGELRKANKISVAKPEEATQKTGVHGKIILEWILGKLCGKVKYVTFYGSFPRFKHFHEYINFIIMRHSINLRRTWQ
jgi:hypothetical protein